MTARSRCNNVRFPPLAAIIDEYQIMRNIVGPWCLVTISLQSGTLVFMFWTCISLVAAAVKCIWCSGACLLHPVPWKTVPYMSFCVVIWSHIRCAMHASGTLPCIYLVLWCVSPSPWTSSLCSVDKQAAPVAASVTNWSRQTMVPSLSLYQTFYDFSLAWLPLPFLPWLKWLSFDFKI